jgi:hypothetical protein
MDLTFPAFAPSPAPGAQALRRDDDATPAAAAPLGRPSATASAAGVNDAAHPGPAHPRPAANAHTTAAIRPPTTAPHPSGGAPYPAAAGPNAAPLGGLLKRFRDVPAGGRRSGPTATSGATPRPAHRLDSPAARAPLAPLAALP